MLLCDSDLLAKDDGVQQEMQVSACREDINRPILMPNDDIARPFSFRTWLGDFLAASFKFTATTDAGREWGILEKKSKFLLPRLGAFPGR